MPSDLALQLAKEHGIDIPQVQPVVATPTPSDIYGYLTEKGVSDAHAKGIIANINAESSFKPDVKEKGVSTGGIGLFQHTGARREALKQAVPDWNQNWKGQIDFALGEPDTAAYLSKDFASPEQASKWFTTNWERPRDASKQAAIRSQNIPDVATPSSSTPSQASPLAQEIEAEFLTGGAKPVEAPLVAMPEPQSASMAPSGGAMDAFGDSYLNSLGLGAVMRQMGKSETMRDVNTAMRGLFGDNRPIEQVAQERQAQVQQAKKDNTGASAIGTIAGILTPVGGSSLAAKGAGMLAADAGKVAKLIAEGGAGAAAYEALTNPNTSASDIGKAAAGGAVVGPVVGTALPAFGTGTKWAANQAMNFLTGTKASSGVGRLIAEHLGPSLTQNSLKDKAVTFLKDQSDQLYDVLKNKYGNVTLNVGDIAASDNVLRVAQRLENTGNARGASRLVDRLSQLGKKGDISLADANKLKSDLYEEAYTQNAAKNTDVAKTLQSLAQQLKDNISKATGNDPQIETFLTNQADAIQLRNAINQMDTGFFGKFMRAAKGAANVATMGATSTPSVTTLGTGAYKLGQGVQNISSEVQQILQTLLPQALTNKK